MKWVLRSFAEAWCLLTTIPLPKFFFDLPFSSLIHKRSAYFYPWVGLFLGVFIALLTELFPIFWPPYVCAAAVLIVWVMLTGAIHLDGLADAFDALMAGHKNRERIFHVFKDPTCGAVAVVAVVLVLLLKFVLLSALFKQHMVFSPVVLALLVSRLSIVPVVLTTPYAGGSMGLLKPFGDMRAKQALNIAFAVMLVAAGVFSFKVFIVLCALVGFLVWAWRAMWIKRIGGYVGDCLGAQVELVESLVLFICFTRAYQGV